MEFTFQEKINPVKVETEHTETRSRRQTCTVCGFSFANSYVTLFTSRPEKREKWVDILSNGDNETKERLNQKLLNSRRYLCYDHFPIEQLLTRPNGHVEVTRNSDPEPYVIETFVRMKYEAFRPLPVPRRKQSEIEKPIGLSKIPEEMTVQVISVLMNAANHYIEGSMNEARKEVKQT